MILLVALAGTATADIFDLFEPDYNSFVRDQYRSIMSEYRADGGQPDDPVEGSAAQAAALQVVVENELLKVGVSELKKVYGADGTIDTSTTTASTAVKQEMKNVRAIFEKVVELTRTPKTAFFDPYSDEIRADAQKRIDEINDFVDGGIFSDDPPTCDAPGDEAWWPDWLISGDCPEAEDPTDVWYREAVKEKEAKKKRNEKGLFFGIILLMLLAGFFYWRRSGTTSARGPLAAVGAAGFGLGYLFSGGAMLLGSILLLIAASYRRVLATFTRWWNSPEIIALRGRTGAAVTGATARGARAVGARVTGDNIDPHVLNQLSTQHARLLALDMDYFLMEEHRLVGEVFNLVWPTPGGPPPSYNDIETRLTTALDLLRDEHLRALVDANFIDETELNRRVRARHAAETIQTWLVTHQASFPSGWLVDELNKTDNPDLYKVRTQLNKHRKSLAVIGSHTYTAIQLRLVQEYMNIPLTNRDPALIIAKLDALLPFLENDLITALERHGLIKASEMRLRQRVRDDVIPPIRAWATRFDAEIRATP